MEQTPLPAWTRRTRDRDGEREGGAGVDERSAG